MTEPLIPEKEYFKIGEVADIVGVKPYVLRYWEAEFRRDIRPERTRSNQRMYRRRDVETFLEIKRLRYEEKLELPGARKRLRTDPGLQLPLGAEDADPAMLEKIRDQLEDLLRIVDEDERDE